MSGGGSSALSAERRREEEEASGSVVVMGERGGELTSAERAIRPEGVGRGGGETYALARRAR